MFIHECEDQWASALAFAPLEADIFHDEIKRAAKSLVQQGKGQFLLRYQLSDLSTYWVDDEIEEAITIQAPASVLMLRQQTSGEPLQEGVLYRKGKEAERHDPEVCRGDICGEIRSWLQRSLPQATRTGGVRVSVS